MKLKKLLETSKQEKVQAPYDCLEVQDLKRWVANRNMVPIGEGCYITTPVINQE